MKKFVASILMIGSLFIGSCRSLPVKQQALAGLETVYSTLETARNTERAICQPTASLVDVVTACTPEAHEMGLTDEKHKKFSLLVADAADKVSKSAADFQVWQVPSDKPSLASIISTLYLIKEEMVNYRFGEKLVPYIDKAITMLDRIVGS